MPWCPACHAEYRAGVRTCQQCQAELVDTPPGPHEHYRPPAENVVEVAVQRVAPAVWLYLRSWMTQVPRGMAACATSPRLVLRMRNLWLLLLAFGLCETAIWIVWIDLPMVRSGLPLFTGFFILWTPGGLGWYLRIGWQQPAIELGRILRLLVISVSGPLGALYLGGDRAAGWLGSALPEGAIFAAVVFVVPLIARTAIASPVVGGTNGWILAALKGEPQGWDVLRRSARKGFGSTWLWLLIIDGTNELLLRYRISSWSFTGAQATLLLLTFLPVAAVLGPGRVLSTAVRSLRLLGARLGAVIGIIVPYAVCAQLLLFVYTASRGTQFAGETGPLRVTAPLTHLVPWLLLTLIQLMLATALMRIALQAEPFPPREPVQPEAAA